MTEREWLSHEEVIDFVMREKHCSREEAERLTAKFRTERPRNWWYGPPPGWWDRLGYHIVVALVLLLLVAVIARLL